MIPSVTNGVPRSLLAASSSMPSSVPCKHKIFRFRRINAGLPWDSWSNCLFARIAASASTCSGVFTPKRSRGYRTPDQISVGKRQMVDLPDPIWLPEQARFHLVAGTAKLYQGGKLLPRLASANVQAVGPIHPKANLTFSQPAPQEKAKNCRAGCPPPKPK